MEPRLLDKSKPVLQLADAPERERLVHVPVAIDSFRAHLAGRTAWQGEKVRIFDSYTGRYRFRLSPEVQTVPCWKPTALSGLLSECALVLLRGRWEEHCTGAESLFRRRGEILVCDTELLEELRRIQGLPKWVFFRLFREWCLSWEVSRIPLERSLEWSRGNT